ncbi:MAG: ATP-binding protein [Anaerolineales bacterium]|jgi:signal transduction histidine kinase
MHDLISCPNCNEPVDIRERFCEFCGADLVIAAILAERAISSPLNIDPHEPISLELLVPRLGDYLISQGVLDETGLQQALDYQREMETAGQPRLIGQALVELDLIDRKTLDKAITEQIFLLQAALQQANRDLEKRVRERTADLRDALKRLAELSQLKSNFVANVSHELRTPLTHIKGYLELMVENELGPLTEQQIEALEVMKRSEEQLEQLIESLIQFSLAEQGDLSLQLEKVDLAGVIRSVAEQSKSKIREKGINLQIDLPAELPKVDADREKLTWAIGQLVDNSIKFTPNHGRMELGAQIQNSLVVVFVTDSGIGIPEDKIEEIFQPFHQLDGSSTRRYAGTGLGLAMVQHIVEAHSSTVNVRSKVGQGSHFEFALSLTE